MARPTSRTVLNRMGRPWASMRCGWRSRIWAGRPSRRSTFPRRQANTFREAIERGKSSETEWNNRLSAYGHAFPDLAKAFLQAMQGELPDGWDRDIPAFPADEKGMATRVAAGKVMNAVAPRLPALIGGSADL